MQREDVRQMLLQAYEDGSWGQYHGRYVKQLVEQLAAYHQVEHVELCCSGTAAVELALRGLRIGPGDEVILAGYDFKGNFADVLAVGAKPVLVDVDPQTAMLNLNTLHEAVSDCTRAIVVSHLHGAIAPMREIMAFAQERGLMVVEDACQMPGAMVQGRRAGCWGDVGVLSFGGSKLLSAGRGGAVFTNEPAVVQRIQLYNQRGNLAYPLSELQAAVLLPQLRTLDEDNRIRSQAADFLIKELEKLPGLLPFRCRDRESTPGYYKLGIWYNKERFAGLSRDGFAHAMQAEGVAVFPGFRALHLSHAQRRYRAIGQLEQAARADREILVLHHPVLLSSRETLRRVAAAFAKLAAAAHQLSGKHF